VALVWLQTQYPNEFVGFEADGNEPSIRAGWERPAYRIHGRAKQVPQIQAVRLPSHRST